MSAVCYNICPNDTANFLWIYFLVKWHCKFLWICLLVTVHDLCTVGFDFTNKAIYLCWKLYESVRWYSQYLSEMPSSWKFYEIITCNHLIWNTRKIEVTQYSYFFVFLGSWQGVSDVLIVVYNQTSYTNRGGISCCDFLPELWLFVVFT